MFIESVGELGDRSSHSGPECTLIHRLVLSFAKINTLNMEDLEGALLQRWARD